MARRSVEILVRGRDVRASETFRHVGSAGSSMGRTIMRSVIPALAAATAGFLSFRAAFRGIRRIIDDFAELEQTTRSLRTALGLMGANADVQTERFQALADEIQRTTTIAGTEFLELVTQGARLGLVGDELENASRAAIGLAEITGRSLRQSMEAVNREIVEGNSSLNRYLPQLRDAADHTERLAILQEFANRGLSLAEDRTNTLAGAKAQLTNALGQMREEIGAGLIPAINALTAETSGANSAIVQFGRNVGNFLAAMIVTAQMAIRLFIFSFQNLGVAVILAGKVVQRTAVGIVEDVRHAMTVQIPQILTWFAANWRDILTDLGNFTRAVFINLVANIATVISSLPDIIAGRVDFSDVWLPLTTGFQAALSELPEIAARGMTETEQRLQSEIDAIGNLLKTGFVDSLTGTARRRGDRRPNEREPIELRPSRELQDAVDEISSAGQRDMRQQLQFDEARLLTRAPGRGDDPQIQAIRVAEQQRDAQNKSASALAKIERDIRDLKNQAVFIKKGAFA